jgi:hypothetical protein
MEEKQSPPIIPIMTYFSVIWNRLVCGQVKYGGKKQRDNGDTDLTGETRAGRVHRND